METSVIGEFAPPRYFGSMATFVYRCPTTGFNVQGFRGDDLRPASPSTEEVYETVTCTACRSVHLVNPLTGHVAGGHSKTKR